VPMIDQTTSAPPPGLPGCSGWLMGGRIYHRGPDRFSPMPTEGTRARIAKRISAAR
jgi:hypothetical protein